MGVGLGMRLRIEVLKTKVTKGPEDQFIFFIWQCEH